MLVSLDTNAWLQPTISGPPPPVRWMHKSVVKDGTKVSYTRCGIMVLIFQMYVFAGTDEEDYDDLHVLQWGGCFEMTAKLENAYSPVFQQSLDQPNPKLLP